MRALRPIACTALVSAALAAAGLAIAPGARGQTADAVPGKSIQEVSDCVTANAPARTMRQQVELESTDRAGDGRRYDMTIEWKKGDNGLAKTLMRLTAPPDLRGSAYLMIEREDRQPDLFSYLPELERVRRLTVRAAAGSLFGSDFSYEDMRWLQNFADSARSTLLGSEDAEGRPVWRIETKPTPEDASAYINIVSLIDRERCVPLRFEFYEREGKLTKLITVPPSHVVREGKRWVPMEISIEDKEAGTRSAMIVKNVELDIDIPDKRFTQQALRRRR
jgi:outer membrane lipoprotein-sorting protein